MKIDFNAKTDWENFGGGGGETTSVDCESQDDDDDSLFADDSSGPLPVPMMNETIQMPAKDHGVGKKVVKFSDDDLEEDENGILQHIKDAAESEFQFGMRLDDIEVPEYLKRRLKCGIQWVDDVLGEGFTPSVAYILEGDPGAGKSTAVHQIASSFSMVNPDALTVFNSTEESPFQIRRRGDRLGIRRTNINMGSEPDVAMLIRNVERMRKPDQDCILFIDSLQSMSFGGKYSRTAQEMAMQILLSWAKQTHAMVFTIMQQTAGKKIAGGNKNVHAIDVHLKLRLDTKEKSEFYGCRIFKAEKNRFGPTGVEYALQMNDRGLIPVAKTVYGAGS
jgi:predicted ATP-dependent serine protease